MCRVETPSDFWDTLTYRVVAPDESCVDLLPEGRRVVDHLNSQPRVEVWKRCLDVHLFVRTSCYLDRAVASGNTSLQNAGASRTIFKQF